MTPISSKPHKRPRAMAGTPPSVAQSRPSTPLECKATRIAKAGKNSDLRVRLSNTINPQQSSQQTVDSSGNLNRCFHIRPKNKASRLNPVVTPATTLEPILPPLKPTADSTQQIIPTSAEVVTLTLPRLGQVVSESSQKSTTTTPDVVDLSTSPRGQAVSDSTYQSTITIPEIVCLNPQISSTPLLATYPHSMANKSHRHLPEPIQSASAGYHRQWQGPRYKVLPAAFGGLDLARSHFGRKGKKRERGNDVDDCEEEKKMRKEMKYTLKRHVEEYWR